MKRSHPESHKRSTCSATNDDDEDDDRKPPARILIVTPTPTKMDDGNQNNNDSEEQQSLDDTTTSYPISPAATASLPPGAIFATPGSVLDNSSSVSSPCKAARPQQLVDRLKDDTTDSATRSDHSRFRRVLLEELLLLGGTAALSLGTFLYLVIPTTALAALALFFSSLAVTLYTLQQALIREARTAIQTTGLGQYLLPSWLYELLTQTSLHEFMTDPTFMLEYRHLMLYFLPGISEQQLRAYLQRLAPHHVQALYRPGLGHLLGNNFMRALIGEQQLNVEGNGTVGLPLPSSTTTTAVSASPRRLPIDATDDDETVSMDFGSEASTDSRGVRIARQLQLVPIQEEVDQAADAPATPPRRPPISTELQNAYNEEERVLTDAITGTAYSAFWRPAVGYFLNLVREYTRPVTQRIVWYGFGLSFISSSAGLVGQYAPSWLGLTSRLTLPAITLNTPGVLVRLPTRRQDSMASTIWTTALVSGTTAMVTLGLQYILLNDGSSESKDKDQRKRNKDPRQK